jgi:alpha-1,6-mannosyltransferase
MFDHHIAVSEHVAAELRPASRGHAVQRAVYVSPMGVDCERFTPRLRSPEERRRILSRVGAPESAALLLYAGRLAREKNLPLLIGMMERLAARGDRDYRLLVAGAGRLRASFERECQRRIPGRTFFLGHVGDREALASLYSNCDVFVHPNPREPFGIAPLEAMAAGLALVGPRSGGLMSYANEGNSWLADATGEGFALAVRAALDPSELRNWKLEAARRTSEANSWAEATSRYLRLYEEIHARWHGRRLDWSQQPSFYSTPGDWLGAEVGGSN